MRQHVVILFVTLSVYLKSFLRVTPMEYVRYYRITQAKVRLLEMEHQRGGVSEVARAIGYAHLGRFSQDCRKVTGISPADLMQLYQKQPAQTLFGRELFAQK